jgi:hypothetical protein
MNEQNYHHNIHTHTHTYALVVIKKERERETFFVLFFSTFFFPPRHPFFSPTSKKFLLHARASKHTHAFNPKLKSEDAKKRNADVVLLSFRSFIKSLFRAV